MQEQVHMVTPRADVHQSVDTISSQMHVGTVLSVCQKKHTNDKLQMHGQK